MAVLDDILPVYAHRERHTRQVRAEPGAVWTALHAVSGRDLPVTRLLMGARRLPSRLARSRTARVERAPERGFIAAFLAGGFRELRVDPPSTWVAGAAGQPWRLHGGAAADVLDLEGFRAFCLPGFVTMAMSFELEDVEGGTRLSTETRVQPIDAAAARAFRPYWWAIRGGSGLIRRDLPQAVRRRAEKVPDATRV